jgi:hypothetical protein
MRRLLIIAILFCPTTTLATSYFLSPTGNDANNGTSAGTPWLSPNHAVNCGDVITASASTSYAQANFASGKWGTVSGCGTGSSGNVAWLKCTTFDACKITTSSNATAITVSASNWGVQGWEVTATSGAVAGCFQARPPTTSTSIHHIIFANDVANQCENGGFSSYNNGAASIDYIVYVGDIAYNTAQTSSVCASGFNIYQPKASDTLSGTHMYVAGSFAWANLNPNPCAGTAPTDGEGLTFDTFDGSQGGGNDYAQQAVAYNNIFIGNGGRCYQTTNNASGSNHAPQLIEYVTCWGNETDTHQNPGGSVGELRIVSGFNNTFSHNLVQTTAATAYGQTLYAAYVATGNGTDTIATNWLYSASGSNCGVQAPANGFACGTNTTGTSPAFSSPSVPGAPSCGSSSSVPNCMTTLISNFTPTASGSTAYGYQIPLGFSITDPLFPAWLCNVNLPAGLVTLGCGAPPTLGSSVGAHVSVGGATSVQ